MHPLTTIQRSFHILTCLLLINLPIITRYPLPIAPSIHLDTPQPMDAASLPSSRSSNNDWYPSSDLPNYPSHSVYTKPLVLSAQDDRHYKLIRLENGLEALLIRDKAADKSTAALDVKVGHLSDPVSTMRLVVDKT